MEEKNILGLELFILIQKDQLLMINTIVMISRLMALITESQNNRRICVFIECVFRTRVIVFR